MHRPLHCGLHYAVYSERHKKRQKNKKQKKTNWVKRKKPIGKKINKEKEI
jgi:hypothetical protein